LKSGYLVRHICTALFATIVILSFAMPRSSAGATPTTMGDYPEIILPFQPGAEVTLAIYWSLDVNMTHSFTFWVVDSDGIDHVIASHMLLSENVWHNTSVAATECNATRSFYEVSFVGPRDGTDWKVFANDTQGHWTENGTIRYLIDMVGIDPKILLGVVVVPVWLIAAAVLLCERRRR
jgi:hypothetical protein